MADTPPPSTESRTRSGCLRWAALVLIVLILTTGILSWFLFGSLIQAAQWLRELPSRLTNQQITQTFRQSVTEIIATQGDILEVATMQTDETITKFDMKTAFNEAVYLGTTISEIRTPVFYRYHIQLSDPWQLQVDQGTCIVHAPALRPSQPPAIRTEGMEKKSEAGWLRFNAAENLALLEKELTPTLEKRAGNPAHLNLIREAARKSVAEFVKRWLLKDAAPDSSSIHSITIIFPDEVKATPGPITQPPTLRF